MTLKDDLIAAKVLIDSPDKWVKGMLRDGARHCLLGAVEVVTEQTKQWPPNERFTIATARLAEAIPDEWQTFTTFWFDQLPIYNDRAKTTHPDIMALFDRAIEAAP